MFELRPEGTWGITEERHLGRVPQVREAVSIKAPGRGGVERWQVELWEGLRGNTRTRTDSDSGSGCSLGEMGEPNRRFWNGDQAQVWL